MPRGGTEWREGRSIFRWSCDVGASRLRICRSCGIELGMLMKSSVDDHPLSFPSLHRSSPIPRAPFQNPSPSRPLPSLLLRSQPLPQPLRTAVPTRQVPRPIPLIRYSDRKLTRRWSFVKWQKACWTKFLPGTTVQYSHMDRLERAKRVSSFARAEADQ